MLAKENTGIWKRYNIGTEVMYGSGMGGWYKPDVYINITKRNKFF